MKTKILLPALLFTFYFSLFTCSAQYWSIDTILPTGANSSGIAITSDGSKLVVTNNTSPGMVHIISTATLAEDSINISSIEDYPNGVAIAPNDSVAIVNTTHNTIYINIKRNTIMGYYAAPCVGTTLYGIAITPDGANAVYPDLSSGCTEQGWRVITATSIATTSTFNQITTSGELWGIAVSHFNGNLGFVTTSVSDVPKIINLSSNSVQNVSGAISGSYGVAMFHKSAQAIYFDGDSIDIVSLTTASVTKKICALDYNTNFQNIAITADDKYAFIIGEFEKFAVSLTADTVLETFTSGQTNVATDSNGSWFYVTDSYNGDTRFYKNTTTSGINQLSAVSNQLSVYPNPNNGIFTIEWVNGKWLMPARSGSDGVNEKAQVEIYNVLGEKVYSQYSIPNTQYSINLSSQPNGVYIYKVIANDGSLVGCGKVVVEK
jgi:hypothetical protein